MDQKANDNNTDDGRLSKVSHDMRTPLNAVLGMSNMILRATDKGDADLSEIHGFAEDIKNAGEELLLLTNDYLYISDVRPDQSDSPSGNSEERVKASVDNDGAESYKPLFCVRNASILVADDNSVNRKVFRNLLRDTGLSIDEATGGYECAAKAHDVKYDMIFLDYMMPDQNGIKTLNRIRTDGGRNAETPVVALTASTVAETVQKLKEAGFDAIISKPITPGELERLIADNLPKEKIISSIEKTPDKKAEYDKEEQRSDQLVAIDIAKLYAGDKEELDGYFRDISSSVPDSFYQYAVKIHSMKTSALMVKAYEPWALAKSLEEAAENENADFIGSVHPVFTKSWMAMGEQLERDYLYSVKTKGTLDPEYEIILHYLGLLEKAVEELDVESADTLLEMIRSYWYPEELAGYISRLNAAVAGLNAADTGKYVSEIRGIISENYITDRKNR